MGLGLGGIAGLIGLVLFLLSPFPGVLVLTGIELELPFLSQGFKGVAISSLP